MSYATPPGAALKALRIVQLICSLIVLGTIGTVVGAIGEVVGCYEEDGLVFCIAEPPSLLFTMFAGAWTLLITIYLVVSAFMPSWYHVVAAIVLDTLSVIFWFASWVSVAVFLGNVSLFVDRGVGFGLAVAGCVFGCFEWMFFVVTLILSAISRKRAS